MCSSLHSLPCGSWSGKCLALPPPVGRVGDDGEGGDHLLLTQRVLRHTDVLPLVVHLYILTRGHTVILVVQKIKFNVQQNFPV